MFRHITNLWSKASLDELPDGRGEELVVGSGIKIEDVSRKKKSPGCAGKSEFLVFRGHTENKHLILGGIRQHLR